jgi:D-sedoheptulose 7-phosphate isomerase
MDSLLDPYDEQMTLCASLMVSTVKKGHNIWLAGNGGSASTAEHFEIDLLKIRLPKLEHAIRVNSLTSNSAVLTAIVNDIGPNFLFSKQLERKAAVGDLVVIISASGSSPNLIEAYKFCIQHDIKCFGILGFDGGELGKVSLEKIHIQSNMNEYAYVENMHLAVCHEISNRFHSLLAQPGS